MADQHYLVDSDVLITAKNLYYAFDMRKHGYPPDLQDAAVQTVLQQAEVLSARWAA